MKQIPRYTSSSMYIELVRRQALQTGLRGTKIRETQRGSGSGTGSVESRLTSICRKTCSLGVPCTTQDAGGANFNAPGGFNGGNANSNFPDVLNGENFCI